METSQVLGIGNIREISNVPRKPRGRKIPAEFIAKAKVREGRNTLSAVGKAYGVSKSHLSEVITEKRNTPHLIQILELEYGMSIEEIRDIWKRNKENLAKLGAKAQISHFGKIIKPAIGE